MSVKTRFLVISDTHANPSLEIQPEHKADVVIHCGDLTDGSKLDEYHHALQLLRDLDAPLKLVIAGNHDFTLDDDAFRRILDESSEPLDPDLVRREYGSIGQARSLFDEAGGIHLLDEGTHSFSLPNGASLTVYASPFTPSANGGAFQYHPQSSHQFAIGKGVDIVITHGPPRGILDMAHGWGARLVAWRETIAESPSHFTEIDNDRSTVVDKLFNITSAKKDTPKLAAEKRHTAIQLLQQGYRATSHCNDDPVPLERGKHTLFANAAVEGVTDEVPLHPFWMVDIDLPSTLS
ncbi:ser/Thr protein phosphatase family protein [Astrocystis sublimbata]|nr:ser/Thr protein phosphatase family protein [Astrocystis sublimbata]